MNATMPGRFVGLILTAVIAAAACSSSDSAQSASTTTTTTPPPTASQPAAEATATQTPTADSSHVSVLRNTVWESNGYGFVVEIDDELRFARFQVTPPLGAVQDFFGSIEQSSDGRLVVVRGGVEEAEIRLADDRFFVHAEWQLAEQELEYTRLPSRPENSDVTLDESPVGVVTYFCRVFESHHAFLQDRIDELAVPNGLLAAGTTWSDHCEAAIDGVSAETTRAELCVVLAQLLAPLGDAHTFVVDNLTQSCEGGGLHPETFSTMSPGTPAAEVDRTDMETELDRAFELVDTGYLDTEVGQTTFASGQISYGAVTDAPILYMRIRAFPGLPVDHGLDTMMGFAADNNLRAVIIDLRANGGGSDALGIEIASRFNNNDYVAYTKKARNDPDDPNAYNDGHRIMVNANNEPGMRDAPIVLLTSRLSISAAETFTMAMIERSPQEHPVIRIGGPTQGVYADVLVRTLPGSFMVGLPNERYLTTTGADYEIHGVMPDIEVPVFAPADLDAGRDPALERAIEELVARL